jgi:hypothetical protein
MDPSEKKVKVEVSDVDGGKKEHKNSHHHHHHHKKSDTPNSAAGNSIKLADSPFPSGTVEAMGKTEATASGSPFESPPIPNKSGLTNDPLPSRPHGLSTPS